MKITAVSQPRMLVVSPAKRKRSIAAGTHQRRVTADAHSHAAVSWLINGRGAEKTIWRRVEQGFAAARPAQDEHQPDPGDNSAGNDSPPRSANNWAPIKPLRWYNTTTALSFQKKFQFGNEEAPKRKRVCGLASGVR